jgi:O-antigen ligase
VFVTISALLLTKSRSSLLALVSSLLAVSPFAVVYLSCRLTAARAAVTASLLAFGVMFLLAGTVILGDRALGVLQFDATVQLRQEALKEAWHLARQHAWLGVGYNAYQFAARDAGLIGDSSLHSRSGADSSLLTLWVTTGLPGVILFVLPWLYFLQLFIRRWITHTHLPSLTAAAGIIFLLIHSLFVNSFLYSHLLIIISFVVALVVTDKQVKIQA